MGLYQWHVIFTKMMNARATKNALEADKEDQEAFKLFVLHLVPCGNSW